MQPYLEEKHLSTVEIKFLLSLRSRMLDIKANYRGKYGANICPCCPANDDTQEHLLKCEAIVHEGSLLSTLPQYQDLFGDYQHKQAHRCAEY